MIAQINNQSTRALQKFAARSTGMGNAAAEITRVADGKGIMSDEGLAARASRDHVLPHDPIWTRAG
jgi:hypothetical protein